MADKYANAMAAISPDMAMLLSQITGQQPQGTLSNVPATQGVVRQGNVVANGNGNGEVVNTSAPVQGVPDEMATIGSGNSEGEMIPDWLKSIALAALGIAPAIAGGQAISQSTDLVPTQSTNAIDDPRITQQVLPALEDTSGRVALPDEAVRGLLPPPELMNNTIDNANQEFSRDRAVPYQLKDGRDIYLQNGFVYDDNGRRIQRITDEFLQNNLPENVIKALRAMKIVGRSM